MKSAYEIAMEKLAKKDAEQGIAGTTLNEDQKNKVAEVRAFYRAKLAEREILHQSDLNKARLAGDPESISRMEEEYRRDRATLKSEMESKVAAIKRRKTKKKGS
ncbi:MAG: hypothetical protein ACE5HU_05305 [Acidobacteriota bacterium]